MSTLNLTMVSPLADYLDEMSDSKLAPRPATLDGKVLGLLPNWRPSAIHILRSLGELLQERYKLKAVIMEQPVRELPLRHAGDRGHLQSEIEHVDRACFAIEKFGRRELLWKGHKHAHLREVAPDIVEPIKRGFELLFLYV